VTVVRILGSGQFRLDDGDVMTVPFTVEAS